MSFLEEWELEAAADTALMLSESDHGEKTSRAVVKQYLADKLWEYSAEKAFWDEVVRALDVYRGL